MAGGIELTTELPSFCLEITDFGKLGRLAMELEGRPLGYKIKILHITPNLYKTYIEDGKYNIGRIFWETDRLPLDFAASAELLDEIWTGSEFNAEAIRKAGVSKPIYIVPEAIDGSIDIEAIEPYIIPNKKDYKFYSIFEWTERKNPFALLAAFWKEFENTEGVSLTIKTYIDNFTPSKKLIIDQYIRRIQKQLNLKRYAPVYLYRGLMERDQIYRFHKSFDCFVSAHRGEGWGIPQMEALLLEKPIISTNLGGIHEYLSDKKDAMLIPYTFAPVDNSRNRNWYATNQQWGEIDQEQLAKAMRWSFENQDKAKKIGMQGRKTVLKRFDLPVVGKVMAERLQVVHLQLQPKNERT